MPQAIKPLVQVQLLFARALTAIGTPEMIQRGSARIASEQLGRPRTTELGQVVSDITAGELAKRLSARTRRFARKPSYHDWLNPEQRIDGELTYRLLGHAVEQTVLHAHSGFELNQAFVPIIEDLVHVLRDVFEPQALAKPVAEQVFTRAYTRSAKIRLAICLPPDQSLTLHDAIDARAAGAATSAMSQYRALPGLFGEACLAQLAMIKGCNLAHALAKSTETSPTVEVLALF